MGWGEPSRPSLRHASDELADVVRGFIASPTTSNRERMESALDRYDVSRRTATR